MGTLTVKVLDPATRTFRDAVIEGLSRTRKSIPPKFFYDERGSRLFEEICKQPEYYLPHVERRMLARRAEEIASLTGTGRILIEPGAGSAAKARLLFEAMRPAAYLPMDISFDYLRTVAADLELEFPWLPVHAVCADFSRSLPMPEWTPEGRRLLFFPGSSLGNFSRSEARSFLDRVVQAVADDGMLLIGVDTKKSEARLDAAYNDAAGATAEFNLNLLHRMRRELDADVDPSAFEHRAFYDSRLGRIEMHLVSRSEQEIRVDGHLFRFGEGESVHTENSYKYAPAEFIALASQSGLRPVRHWMDDEGLFAVYLLEVR
jgi:dimethylhistidine N-methyltransferase